MSGEPREDMDIPLSDRLPPAVASRAFTWTSDSALSGAPLPPYRPGMYSGLVPAKPAISQLSAALEAEQEVGPPVAEGWPAAWRDDPIPAEKPDQPESSFAAGEAAHDAAEEPAYGSVEEPAYDAAEEPAYGSVEQPAYDAAEEPAAEEPAYGAAGEPDVLFLDEAEIEPAEPERDPTGYEQAVEEPAIPESPPEPAASAPWEEPAAFAPTDEVAPEPAETDVGGEEVWSWDEEETPVYDLAAAAAEDTGPWQDSWAPAADMPDALEAEPAAEQGPVDELGTEPQDVEFGEPDAGADIQPLASLDEPESVADVQEWLEGGAVESYGWGVEPEEPAAEFGGAEWSGAGEAEWSAGGEAGWPAAEEAEWPADGGADWPQAEPGEETGELVEMVEQETDFGAALEFSPVEDASAAPPADEAWAPVEPREPRAGQPETETEAAAPPAEQSDDERVAIVPPTPIDSWFHGEHGADAAATWEAFGRALEEAASWGEPAPPAAAASPSPEALAPETAAVEQPAAAAASEEATPAPADPAVADLARRLELLARRLREEGEKGMEHALSEGDRLEASLAGFIAGYVAARRG